VWGCGGKVNEGDESKRIWLMDFIYKIEERNLSHYFKWCREGVKGEDGESNL
jgi:hypothetical protein